MTKQRELDVRGAAEYLGVHLATIRRWLSTGALRGRRVGPKLIRIAVADLDALGSTIGAA